MAKSKNYLNKKDLLDEIYKSREKDEMTPKCLEMLMLLAQKTIRKLYYKCEDDKQHALSEAYYDLVKNWRKFDPDFARFFGYATLKAGDEIRVYPEKGVDRTAAAMVVENYPIEPYIEKITKELTKEKCTNISYVISKDGNTLTMKYLPKGIKLTDSLSESNWETKVYDSSSYNKIKLDYIVKKNQREIAIFDKRDIIIKDPNPFSFFTSSCINGYAKGWKRLYPKKSKGLLLSIDSGFNTDSDGVHSF